jgi:hypothetical protein
LSACSGSAEGSGTVPATTTPSADTSVSVELLPPPARAEPPDVSAVDSPVTTSTVPALDVYDPDCVVEVQPGESLGLIANRFDDDTVRVSTICAENGLSGDLIFPGQLLDVCVDNGINDITGAQSGPNPVLLAESTRVNVAIQQEHLNRLFDGFAMAPLAVDGVSGPLTRQRLCAARVALDLPISRDAMEPAGQEQEVLMAAERLSVPATTAVDSERWILIDQTCQVMFVGEGSDNLVFVFPTSTGEAGYETRDQDRTRAFRFDPAVDNGGWHDSSEFPVAEDNPLNGNMYRPLYFDRGQAIHGANNVPTSPQSKGCARLRMEHQDALIAWLGLDSLTWAINDRARIDVTVNVQGAFDPS